MSGLQLWAPDAAFINDTYYLIYCAIERATNIFRTGIAVSPTPQGPFTDTGFVVGVEWGQDPALFVDHDDVPYLFWGSGGGAQMAQLTPDLKSAVPSSVKDLTKQLPNFYEGPWMFSRNGAYYLMYAGHNSDVWGETLEYATAPHPTGPFEYGGVIMKTLDHYPEVGKSWTNHGSITKYKGQWYLFYHTTGLSNGHDKRRSFAIEYLHFDDEGGIWPIEPTLHGVRAVEHNSTGANPNTGPVMHRVHWSDNKAARHGVQAAVPDNDEQTGTKAHHHAARLSSSAERHGYRTKHMSEHQRHTQQR